MVGLLLGVLLIVQTPDSIDKNMPVLSDSTITIRNGHINLTNLDTWRYKAGDDSVWASPDFDDSNWLNISSPSAISDSLFQGIGWFRMSFQVDSSFTKKPLFFNYSTFGASELFINGEKITQVGVPSSIPDKERLQHLEWWSTSRYLNPINFQPGEKVVVAIKYSLHDEAFFEVTNIGKFEAIQVSINIADIEHLQPLIKEGKEALIAFLISIVLLGIVIILHLAMHFRFEEERGNFWIFLISVLLFISPFISVLNISGIIESQKVMQLSNLTGFLQTYLPISLIPICLAKLLSVEINKLWYFLVLYPFVDLIIDIFYQGNTPIFASILVVSILGIIVAIGAYIIIREAKKSNQKYLWLIASSLFSYPIMFIFAVLLLSVFSYNSTALTFILVLLLYTTLPVGFSIYQILRFFNSHDNLQEEVNRQTAELEKAYRDLQKSLKDLKSTQDQLVKQEKLASLGQLTAGIAHEIKNPLNFVNNFSDLSVELVEESKEELSALSHLLSAKEEREKVDEALAILEDIEANLRKIHEHGSRADNIVKSMLQHSRGGTGKMEPTDLNGLVKEYVNLSFHGMRAGKDPINVEIEMELDDSIGEVPLIAEDFSRVIVNLCNNAFDAMGEKLSALSDQQSAYQPKLTVRTKTENGKVAIEIEDNGPGIPVEMKDKILQPFFTTKKGTEGTGLGLSITHDIVKAHGAEMKIESQKNEYTCFKINLIA